MPKMTKPQMKRALMRMKNKTLELVKHDVFTATDYVAMLKIIEKGRKRLER